MKELVVIGSGAGGLCAAILLGQRGWRVTVLEQHYRAGGCLHRFFRRGLGYDTGFHYVGSAGPDGSFAKLLRHLGVADAIRLTPLDPDGFDVLRFPDFEFRVPAGLDRWAARLKEAFPHEAAGVDAYVALHRAAVACYGLYTLDPTVAADAPLPWESRTLGDVLATCFTTPRIRAVIGGHGAPLYGVAPHEAPFGIHAVVTDHFLTGAATIGGGGDHLAQVLCARVRELGGRVLLRTEATAIRVEDGVAVGVDVADGRRFPADLIYANLHPRRVLELLPPGSTRPAYQERVLAARPGRGHFGLYLRVRGNLDALRGRNLYRFAHEDIDRMDGGNGVPFYFLTAPATRDEGEGVVLGLTPTDQGFWESFEGDLGKHPGGAPVRGADYTEAKAAMLARVLAVIQADFPDWEILRAEGSTPLTLAHYTGVPRGATYGHHHAVDQMGRYRLPMLLRVRHLVQIGQAVAFPGICGAMMSACAAVGGMIGMDQMIAELRAA